MHFLVMDNRFVVPIFVFLESDPSDRDGYPRLHGRWVTLEPAAATETTTRRAHIGSCSSVAVGGDPSRADRFAKFESDTEVRAAGFALIEPQYIGPSWETYLNVFHPEGGKRSSGPPSRLRVIR